MQDENKEEMLEEMTEQEAFQMKRQQLEIFGARLMRLAEEQVSQRSDIEERWFQDLRQYNGQYDPEIAARLNSDPTKSKVFVNSTRSKTNTVEARLIDMLFPTDDKNWGISPTPVPEIMQSIDSQEPAPNGMGTVGDMAFQVMKEAQKRAEKMDKEISDQLEESEYNIRCRDMIHDACVLGTGVLKAPVIIGRERRAWRPMDDGAGNSVQVLEIVADKRPAVERVDPWDFFPDMSATNIEQAEFVLQRHFMTKREIRELLKRPGFIKESVVDLLKTDPDSSRRTDSHIDKLRSIAGLSGSRDENRYEIWEYHGPVDTEELRVCGVEQDDEEVLESYEGIVWFSGNHILKAVINPMDTDERPYSVFCLEQDDTSIFGFGVPRQMRNSQRVMNSAWRMMLENGGLSVGGQVVVNRQIVEPADGDWKLRGRKVWFLTDNTRTVHDAFKIFEIGSNQNDLAAVFNMARSLVDEETATPMIAQGEIGSAPVNTSSGMSMLMNNSNTVLRRVVKNYDDNITSRVIRRFYDWNMQFNTKAEIKGDFEVKARGTSALLVKEQQQQSLIQMMQLTANPVLGQMVNLPELLRKTAQAMHLSPDELVKSDEQIAKETEMQQRAMAEQPNPEMLKIESSYKMHQERMQSAAEDRQVRLAQSQIDYQVAVAKLAQERDISVEKANAMMQQAMINAKVKRQNFLDEANLKANTGGGI